MTSRVLVVEDEIFVAIEIEHLINEIGHEVVGTAADAEAALRLASEADIALVDLNLRDGLTGPRIGKALAEHGVTVLFLTANPGLLGDGVPGTLGVIPKPIDGDELEDALSFAAAARMAAADQQPPVRMRLFA